MIRIFFGNIGCGKTTVSCYLMKKYQKKKFYKNFFANFKNKLSIYDDLDGLGLWTFPKNSYIAVDEAGIDFNNRKYKTLSQAFIKWLKLSRHYECDLDFFSQSWDDMDITIRRLASEYWYVKKLGCFTLTRRVIRYVGIDDNTHQITDMFKFVPLWKKFLPPPFNVNAFYIIFRPKYYKYFDTLDAPLLTTKY